MKLIINTNRDAYSISDIRSTMTVADLACLLEQYDDDTPVYLSFDNGYTYGGVHESMFEEDEEDDKE